MYQQQLSDKKILEGFCKGDSEIIREYFYGYCRTGYYLFDQRYQLSEKENLDFMSLAPLFQQAHEVENIVLPPGW